MIRDTGALIRELATCAEPVKPLLPPWIRAAIWVGLSLVYLAPMVVLLAPAVGLGANVSDDRFIVEQVAALTTGLMAAIAAFATIVPGYRRAFALLPVLPCAIWLGDLGRVCVRDLQTFGSQGWALAGHWACFPTSLVVGALPTIAMLVMLRHGAPLTPRLTTGLGALAAAGVANFGVRFIHAQDASIIVMAWHVGAVLALSAAVTWAGRALFNWRSMVAPGLP